MPSSSTRALKSIVTAAVVVAATTAASSAAAAQNVANGNSGIVPPHLRGDSVVPQGIAVEVQRVGANGKDKGAVVGVDERPIIKPEPADQNAKAGNDEPAGKKNIDEKDQTVHILPYPYSPVNNNKNKQEGKKEASQAVTEKEALAEKEELEAEEEAVARESIADVAEGESGSGVGQKDKGQQLRPDFGNIIEGEDDEEIFADVEASIHADTIGSIMLPPPHLKGKRGDKNKKKKSHSNSKSKSNSDSKSNSNSNSDSNSKVDEAEGDDDEDTGRGRGDEEDHDDASEEKGPIRLIKGWRRGMRRGQNGKLRHHSKSLKSPMLLFDGEKFVANVDENFDEEHGDDNAEKRMGKWRRRWHGRKHRRNRRRDAEDDEEEEGGKSVEDSIAQLEQQDGDGQEVGVDKKNVEDEARPEREQPHGDEDRKERRRHHRHGRHHKNHKRRSARERGEEEDVDSEANDGLIDGQQEHAEDKNIGGSDGRLEAKQNPHKNKDKKKNQKEERERDKKKKKSESESESKSLNDFFSNAVGKISKFLGIGGSASNGANKGVVEAERPIRESVLLRGRAMSPQRKIGGNGEQNMFPIPPPPAHGGAAVEGQGLARGKRAGLAPWILDKDPQKPAPNVVVFTSSPNPNEAAQQNAVVEDASIPLAVLSDPDDREEAGDEPNVMPLPFFPPNNGQKRGHGLLVNFGNDPDQQGGRHGGLPNRRGDEV